MCSHWCWICWICWNGKECKDWLHGNTWTKEQILFIYKPRQCVHNNDDIITSVCCDERMIEEILNKHETRNATFYQVSKNPFNLALNLILLKGIMGKRGNDRCYVGTFWCWWLWKSLTKCHFSGQVVQRKHFKR